jgi:thymidylate kinase
VREAYRTLGADRGWVVLDGNDDPEVVSERVWEVVRERLGL